MTLSILFLASYSIIWPVLWIFTEAADCI